MQVYTHKPKFCPTQATGCYTDKLILDTLQEISALSVCKNDKGTLTTATPAVHEIHISLGNLYSTTFATVLQQTQIKPKFKTTSH